jgi:hypothetical protein
MRLAWAPNTYPARSQAQEHGLVKEGVDNSIVRAGRLHQLGALVSSAVSAGCGGAGREVVQAVTPRSPLYMSFPLRPQQCCGEVSQPVNTLMGQRAMIEGCARAWISRSGK